MVASLRRRYPYIRRNNVSIPFIAGQWSLRSFPARDPFYWSLFQSPSLRGSGRFAAFLPETHSTGVCFNPLHCGAVVASRNGTGRWPCSSRFNPLHCGAVVASRAEARARQEAEACFNPLHCGAVVASGPRRDPRGRALLVSIPFIAGQWSLPVRRRGAGEAPPVSIPFIAGQWSLRAARGRAHARPCACFNPLHCGAVVASGDARRRRCARRMVSIPFIAGQWSLRAALDAALDALRPRFQSPSLRGSGRFEPRPPTRRRAASSFQSPSLRGSGRFDGEVVDAVGRWLEFQSPSLRGSGRFPPSPHGGRRRVRSFNPLHCGAVVASPTRSWRAKSPAGVSIPFIAGQWSLPFIPLTDRPSSI